jgi:hypothetical protein
MTTMASEDNRAQTEASDGEGTEPISSPEAQAQIAGDPSPLQATGTPAGRERSKSAGPETKRGRPRRPRRLQLWESYSRNYSDAKLDSPVDRNRGPTAMSAACGGKTTGKWNFTMPNPMRHTSQERVHAPIKP